MKPRNLQEQNPSNGTNVLGVGFSAIYSYLKFITIMSEKTFHSNRRPSTTGPIDLTALPWTRRRSIAVDILVSLNDRIREIGGAHHV